VIKLVCEGAMTVSRLRDIPGIGVDKVGDARRAAHRRGAADESGLARRTGLRARFDTALS
jgi:hypothetical protein